jgi:KUP system potassium uptake protein
VFLALTGGEALYADMGHFGKRPIRIAWLALVFPALLLNYFGQAAFVLANPAAIKNPFYLMVPEWGLYPMVVLATAATVIASQAAISGAFSMTRQAIQLGYIPRLEILHTSERSIGQIYVPFVNWSLFVAVVLLVLGFQSSSNLANAYGIAVAATMVIECILAMVVARLLWKWSPWVVGLVIGSMFVVDFMFLASNAAKFLSGGWFPVLIGSAIFTLLTTWKRGRALMFRRLSEQGIPLKPFLEGLEAHPPVKVQGTAIFMTSQPDTVPHALLHNLKHNKVLHERNLFVTVRHHELPWIATDERCNVEPLGNDCWQVTLHFGFKNEPDVPLALEQLRASGCVVEDMDTSYFLSRDIIVPTMGGGMADWREKLFAGMHRNAAAAAAAATDAEMLNAASDFARRWRTAAADVAKHAGAAPKLRALEPAAAKPLAAALRDFRKQSEIKAFNRFAAFEGELCADAPFLFEARDFMTSGATKMANPLPALVLQLGIVHE